MDAESLWPRYSKIWSAAPALRARELRECLADDATYCDPNGALHGRAALSDYMGGFQQSVPGGRFEILQVTAHNGRSAGPLGALEQRRGNPAAWRQFRHT